MNTTRIAVSLFLVMVSSITGQAQFSSCSTPVQCRQVYNYPTVVKKEVVVEKDVLVATFVPLVVTVPTYSATYVGGYVQQAQYTPAQAVGQTMQPTPAPQQFDVNALTQALTRINDRLTTIETQIQGGVSVNGQGNDFTKLFVAKCASCHDQHVAKTKGGDFALTKDGAMLNLTQEQVLSVVNNCYDGTMPKGGKLTDQEIGLIMAWSKAMRLGQSKTR